jgi:hypothetical protein
VSKSILQASARCTTVIWYLPGGELKATDDIDDNKLLRGKKVARNLKLSYENDDKREF